MKTGKKKKKAKHSHVKPKSKYSSLKQSRRRKGNRAVVTIRQPRKRRFVLHKPSSSHKSMRYQDSSFYSSGTGKKPLYKRRARGLRKIDGSVSGFRFDQDNEKKYLTTIMQICFLL